MDHAKVQYLPFRKNFYVEVPELARLSEEGWLSCQLVIVCICLVGLALTARLTCGWIAAGFSGIVLSLLSYLYISVSL